jgi:hypothetical protein
MNKEEAKEVLNKARPILATEELRTAIDMAIEALSADASSDLYKRGFEDAKRAFLVEYARESENIRKRNAQLEVMLNAQKAISADAVQVVRCKDCKHYKSDGGSLMVCSITEMITDDNDYCSCGERKE